jgi:hypothetical protein
MTNKKLNRGTHVGHGLPCISRSSLMIPEIDIHATHKLAKYHGECFVFWNERPQNPEVWESSRDAVDWAVARTICCPTKEKVTQSTYRNPKS